MTHTNDLPNEFLKASGSDGSLVRRFQLGEQDAATALYRRYAERLEKLAVRNTGNDLAVRFDSEDVVQSVFRTFFRRVQGGAYNLPEGEELWRLLLVLALNKIRKLAAHHRAQKRSVKTTTSPGTELLQQLPGNHEDGLALESLKTVIQEVLSDMTETQQQIVTLRIDGWQLSQIAKETRRSLRTVERVLQTFRSRLRGLVDDPNTDN